MGGRAEGILGSCLMGPEFQFSKVKSSGNWLHDNVSVVNTIKLYIFKQLRWYVFKLCKFHHNFLKNATVW